MPLLFGTDGLRGVANRELTPEIAVALGRAAARHLGGSPYLLGRDTRRSGPMLQAALAAGLASEGLDVLDVGVLPTPGLAWLAGARQVPAAMISASHNPFADNGIKLLGPGGTKLSLELEVAIQDELAGLFAVAAGNRTGEAPELVGSVTSEPEAVVAYAEHLVSIVADAALPGGEVVVDCANGAASAVAPLVLGRLGLRHRIIFAEPDGTNINAACGSTNPARLAAEVVRRRAALGIAFDGDADRMLAIDEAGELVDGDQLMAMFAIDRSERGVLKGDKVVITVMSNLGLRQSFAARGIGVVETPVGDRHVADAMESEGLVLGGEQSGHLIFSEYAATGDGILTALLLLELLGRRQASLGELAASSMRRLPQVLHNVPVAEPSRLSGAESVWSEVSAVESELAGSGRVLLRPSGTEPCVRVMVEAPTPELAIASAGRLVAAVRQALA
ncbi:MAG: phosphoglucosamine mutase [Actinomycetota bacterium]|nr:phosphoglucosamine mutase [Actinomycetota bacterium]